MFQSTMLHHYHNKSVTSDPTKPAVYDGDDTTIPPRTCVILVPCNDPDHDEPSAETCLLVTRRGVERADETQLFIVYVIDNTSEEGIKLTHGDLLDNPYTASNVVAERCLLMVPEYKDMIKKYHEPDLDDILEELDEIAAEMSPRLNTPTLEENLTV
jgi:hypothetical protein